MVRRNTIQGQIVLDAVLRLKNHPTADEVYEAVKSDGLGRATVYRNLNRLCEQGKLAKREIPGSADRYDHVCTKHYHLRCEKCGRIVDANMDYLEGLEQKLKDTDGFDITSHDIIFKGICSDCKK